MMVDSNSLQKINILPPQEIDTALISKLVTEVNVSEIIATLLVQRNLTETDTIDNFLNPQLKKLHSPFKFCDMEKAVERISSALKNREKICIYGDYDVDGITSTSLLMKTLKDLSADVFYYIPNRLLDGYGLSEPGIREVKDRGASLVITVDCGISSHNEIEVAKELDMDIIITDHHIPGKTVPDAYAVINPKTEDSNYPDINLAGVGVAFKLAQGVIEKLTPNEKRSKLTSLLHFVTIGTAADIVPLLGENRILLKHGFEWIKKIDNEGVKALFHATDLSNSDIGTSQIVFKIAPLINAAGRLGSPDMGVDLFISENFEEASNIADKLKKLNLERRELDSTITEECFTYIDKHINLDEEYFIVLSSEEWHLGVIGIVASRIVEKYSRPTLILSEKDGYAKGSARSIHGFHVLDAFKNCDHLLEAFGGHKYAAGVSIKSENVDKLRRSLNTYAKTCIQPENLVPSVKTDVFIKSIDDIDWDLVNSLNQFEPFGPGNMRPIFYSENVAIAGYPKIVGANHLRFSVKGSRQSFNAIAFNMGDYLDYLMEPNIKVKLAYTIEENEWMGKKSIQLNVKGIE